MLLSGSPVAQNGCLLCFFIQGGTVTVPLVFPHGPVLHCHCGFNAQAGPVVSSRLKLLLVVIQRAQAGALLIHLVCKLYIPLRGKQHECAMAR